MGTLSWHKHITWQFRQAQGIVPTHKNHDNLTYFWYSRHILIYTVIMNRQRKNIRLPHYDYTSEGMYFITICTRNRKHYFGSINKHHHKLNYAGEMLKQQWLQIPNRFPFVSLHKFIVMPNHFHAIIEINHSTGINIGNIIGAFKSITTNHYIYGINHHGWQPFTKRLWQQNYYEHVTRNEKSYLNLSDYIQNNPTTWQQDIFFWYRFGQYQYCMPFRATTKDCLTINWYSFTFVGVAPRGYPL